MMADEDIICHIVWHRSAAPFARGGPKVTISGTIDPLKPGDKPVGESVTFRFNCPKRYVQAAIRKVQRDIVTRYRKYNEAAPEPGPAARGIASQMLEGWSPN